MKPPIYAFTVLAQGEWSWKRLEGLTDNLQMLLNNDESVRLQRDGWELFQINTLNDREGNNGFVIVFRREVSY